MGNDFIYLNSIETYCEYCGFEIKHPLVAVVNMAEAKRNYPECKLNYGFYALWLKQGVACSLRYGRRKYDYQEGTVVSFAPGQVVKVEPEQLLDMCMQFYDHQICSLFCRFRRKTHGT